MNARVERVTTVRPVPMPTRDGQGRPVDRVERIMADRLRIEAAVLRARILAAEALAAERQDRILDLRMVIGMMPTHPAPYAKDRSVGLRAPPLPRPPRTSPAPPPIDWRLHAEHLPDRGRRRTFKKEAPDLGLSVEAATGAVPADGRYYVVLRGETVYHSASKRSALRRYREEVRLERAYRGQGQGTS